MKIINKTSTVVSAVVFAFSLVGPAAVFAASPATVDLGSAGNFVILSKTGISTTGSTSIVGDVGISPAAASYITGFALTLPAAGVFSSSALVTGKVYAPGYADPTSANLTTAVLDMQTAYTNAAGRAPDVTELSAGNIGGLTFAPGVYKWGTGVTIPTDITLSGAANDVWIFQIAQNLDISSAAKVILAGGAQANNIFWVVAGQTTINTTAFFNGNILDQTAIVLNTGAQLNGRALAQTAVTLDSNVIIAATYLSSAPVQTSTPSTPAVSAATTAPATVAATPSTPSSAVSNSSATSATPASGTSPITTANREGLIATITELIKAKTQGNATPNANAVVNANTNASFNRNLTVGSAGDDVKALQAWLNTSGYTVALNGSGSLGNETTIFGSLTRAALAKFQAKVGINPSLGYFGPITRSYLAIH